MCRKSYTLFFILFFLSWELCAESTYYITETQLQELESLQQKQSETIETLSMQCEELKATSENLKSDLMQSEEALRSSEQTIDRLQTSLQKSEDRNFKTALTFLSIGMIIGITLAIIL